MINTSHFCFERLVKTPISFSVNSSKPRHRDFDLRHFRLGHAPLERIDVIHESFPDIKCTKDLLCQICLLAKQKKLPFTVHIQNSKSAFELVHMDIWGPYETITFLGQRYFLTTLDD